MSPTPNNNIPIVHLTRYFTPFPLTLDKILIFLTCRIYQRTAILLFSPVHIKSDLELQHTPRPCCNKFCDIAIISATIFPLSSHIYKTLFKARDYCNLDLWLQVASKNINLTLHSHNSNSLAELDSSRDIESYWFTYELEYNKRECTRAFP